jgi:hypothetical protein
MEQHRPPYLWAFVGFLGVLGLYALTLAPSTALWDASEYITTAHILGIPHPPGNPLFVALARTWLILLEPTGLSVAVRVNLLAAASSAGACALLFLVAHRILDDVVRDPRARLLGAACSLVLGATAFTVWNQSTVNEKVYTVSVFLMALATWLLVLWYDRRDEPRALKLLLLAAYLLVLGSTNHLMSALAGPAMLVLVLISAPRTFLKSGFWVRVVPLLVLGLSFNLFLPIRAEQRPVINEGDPVCESLVDATRTVLTNGRSEACLPLSDVLTRFQYQKPPLTERQAPLSSQLLNYFQYFDWQWARGADPGETPGLNTRLLFSLVFLALGILGLWMAWRADWRLFTYLLVLTGTLTVGLVLYLNFKYGYSLAPEVTDRTLHEVRERDYFFLASFIFWGFLAGLGLAGVWGLLARGSEGGTAEDGRPAPSGAAGAAYGGGIPPRRWLLTSPVLLVALIPLLLNWSWASRSGDYAARDWAYNLLMSVEPYGILFTNGDNDTFPLWYVQEVEGLRKDVTVIVVQYLYTDWYVKQLQELTTPERQRPFDPEIVPGLYEDRAAPSRAIVTASGEDLDRVRGGVVGEDFTVPIGPVAVAYPEGTAFDRAELLALAIIRDSFNQRPIYFASGAGMMSQLGVGPWGIRQGVLHKLNPGDPEEVAEALGLVQNSANLGGDWWDYDRSMRLAREVYTYRGLKDRAIWADRSTLNIPWHFYALHLQLADAAQNAGEDLEIVDALITDGESFGITAQGGYVPLGQGGG